MVFGPFHWSTGFQVFKCQIVDYPWFPSKQITIILYCSLGKTQFHKISLTFRSPNPFPNRLVNEGLPWHFFSPEGRRLRRPSHGYLEVTMTRKLHVCCFPRLSPCRKMWWIAVLLNLKKNHRKRIVSRWFFVGFYGI